jgi:hypothetical protein
MIADPPQLTKYVTQDGRLTPEGWLWLQSLVAYIRALEARVAALEAP